ncbi:aldehyde dehydrogenase family protein [Streptomyces sp. BH106]|uniref:aldehyde dehydrogenase family protein n=1 Tax=Streptomyces sp. BH106 TaxID=3410409 RepID=UPI003CECD594
MAVNVAEHAGRVADILGHPGKMPIGDEWVAASSGATLTTSDPGTGRALAEVPLAGAEDVDRAVSEARQAFTTWRRTAPLERAAILWRIADTLEAHADELALLETLDTGKPLEHSRGYDLNSAINEFRYMSGLAARVNGRLSPLSTMPSGVFHSYTRLEPLGVIGAITPWNFPLANASWKIAPALACGNTVVLKPSEETPLTTIRAAELMLQAGLPAGVVNVVTGDGSTGQALVRHPGVNKITFTGSTSTGQEIARVAAENMTRVSLELGGKSPNVIFADADIEAAILGAVGGGFWDSGEVCSSGSRLYVERPALDRVLEGLRKATEAMPIGHGLEPDTAIGPLISARHLDRVSGYVEEARGEGVEVAFGGERLDREGHFYRPTALLGASPDSKVINEEIFGPVLTVVPFDDATEVIDAANATSYGLAAGVWTSDIAKAHHFSENVEAGVVWVNSYGVVDPTMPWGGLKKSGWGRENGEQALHEFTEAKAVCMQVGSL